MGSHPAFAARYTNGRWRERTELCKAHFLRTADIRDERSESRLAALLASRNTTISRCPSAANGTCAFKAAVRAYH